MRNVWRGSAQRSYGRSMARAAKAEPVRQPEALKDWAGYWVALVDDKVIAAAHSPRELVAKLHEMGPSAAQAVARYVPEPSDVIVIGVG